MAKDYEKLMALYDQMFDYLSDEDDFRAMEDILVSLAPLNKEKAMELWLKVVSKYHYIFGQYCLCNASAAMDFAFETIADQFDLKEIDNFILANDNELSQITYNYFFKWQCQPLTADYGEELVIRLLQSEDFDDCSQADRILYDVYQNQFRYRDFDYHLSGLLRGGHFSSIGWRVFAKWCKTITNKKELTKIKIKALTDYNIDLDDIDHLLN